MSARKYRMTRMEGDYFFLANDGVTLCRVGSYEEDGSAEGVTGRFWVAFLFNGTHEDAGALIARSPEDFFHRWGEAPFGGPYWREVAFMCKTRREAVDEALRAAESRAPSGGVG